jgi:hypothetical protein
MTTRATQTRIDQAVEAALVLQESELAEVRQRQVLAVVSRTATGSGDINHAFGLGCKFRLVYVRCHFVGTPGTAPLHLSLDSATGSAYDARLFTITQAGVDHDVHLRIGRGDTGEPSAWTFQADDSLRVQWTNPDNGNITWGLEMGLTIAS